MRRSASRLKTHGLAATGRLGHLVPDHVKRYGESMTTPSNARPFEWAAAEYHARLPGFIRAALIDHGISEEVIDRRQLGWDGAFVTVPVRDARGRVVLFERWDAGEIVTPVDRDSPAELYPCEVLTPTPRQIIVAEGVHEALVFESQGFTAVTATGTGRVLKLREWGPLIGRVPEVVLAYRRGEWKVRGKYALSRSALIAKALRAFPQARYLEWPDEVGDDGGAYAFFVGRHRTAEDFERLVRERSTRW